GKDYNDMNHLIERISEEEIEQLRVYIEDDQNDTISIDDVKLLSPIERPIHDISCIGLNYIDHVDEVRGATDYWKHNTNTVYLSKRSNRINGTGEPIEAHLDLDSNLD